MNSKQAKQQAIAAIEKARKPPVAGWWFDSFDCKGRPCRMFVPA